MGLGEFRPAKYDIVPLVDSRYDADLPRFKFNATTRTSLMPSYLLSKQGSADLETVVFKLDQPGGDEEGIPVFTSEELAYAWLQGSDFQDDYEAVMLDDLAFMFWCTEVCQGGIGHLILDPNRALQSAGEGQDTIDLAGHLAWSAKQLMTAHQRAA